MFLATGGNCSCAGVLIVPSPPPADHQAMSNDATSSPAQGGQEIERDGFLSNHWRDSLAIVGVVGVVLTAWGVWWSWRSLQLAAQQLERTRTANEAATKAAIQALEDSRKQYDKHLLTEVQTLLEAAKIYVESENWQLASLRVRDVTHALTQLVTVHGFR
jgi:hypothetical protein